MKSGSGKGKRKKVGGLGKGIYIKGAEGGRRFPVVNQTLELNCFPGWTHTSNCLAYTMTTAFASPIARRRSAVQIARCGAAAVLFCFLTLVVLHLGCLANVAGEGGNAPTGPSQRAAMKSLGCSILPRRGISVWVREARSGARSGIDHPSEMSLWSCWVSGQLGDRPLENPSPQGGSRDLTFPWYEPREA